MILYIGRNKWFRVFNAGLYKKLIKMKEKENH